MMKPPFKASDSGINVLSAPWFDKDIATQFLAN